MRTKVYRCYFPNSFIEFSRKQPFVLLIYRGADAITIVLIRDIIELPFERGRGGWRSRQEGGEGLGTFPYGSEGAFVERGTTRSATITFVCGSVTEEANDEGEESARARARDPDRRCDVVGI